MYIRSKLVEASKTICDLRIEDQYEEDKSIYVENIVDKAGNHVHVDSKILHTSGLCIMETFLSIAKKVTDLFYIDGEHVKFTFFLNGKSRVCELPQDQTFDLDIGVMRRNYLFHSKWDVEMKGDNEINYIAIMMSKNFFLHLIQRESWAEDDRFIRKVYTQSATADIDETYPISLPILKTLRELLACDHLSQNKRYYIELKLKELFFLIHEHLHTLSETPYADPSLYKTLEKVKAYLIVHFNHPPTIRQLSRMFSLNEMKLKQGFKAYYGITIYAYVIQLRMEKAQKMLLENFSVNEMSAELGYNSVSHFISTFKSYFGHTPKQALKHISKIIPLTLLSPCLDYLSFIA